MVNLEGKSEKQDVVGYLYNEIANQSNEYEYKESYINFMIGYAVAKILADSKESLSILMKDNIVFLYADSVTVNDLEILWETGGEQQFKLESRGFIGYYKVTKDVSGVLVIEN